MAVNTELLKAAEEARKRADWERARDLYMGLLEADPDEPEALDGLGMISWWLTGHAKEAIEYRRRAYAEFRRRGDRCRAAGIAVYIAAESRIEGNEAAANGWLARGARLLEGLEECSERGWLEVERAKRAASPEEQRRHAREAVEIARRLDDSDLEVSALGQLGLARTLAGEIEEGMTILDEAMAAATGGEASDPLAIGDVCCSTLVACEQLADFRRAADWCRVVVEFTRRRNYTPLAAWCRTIYAGVLTTTGDWKLAEEELREALATYERLGSPSRVFALARLAELRFDQGRFEEAERLLEGFEDHPLALVPVVALDLARGQTALAAERVEARLAAVTDAGPATAPLLSLLADVRIAEGDLDGARDAADHLRELGRNLSREHLIAAAELAAARVSGASGDGAAAAHLQAALDLFARLEMPLDEARARLELARCHAVRGSELAVPEARAALSVFERLGAARDADAAAKLLRSLGVAGRTAERGATALTKREREVLDLLGAGLSNAEIAERLFITPKTAEHHVGRVLSKLGLRNRTEAAAYLLREHAAHPEA
ncbi:MAG: LuxR C-terminal-related transcriptional regulator [Gaiellaceae bacterium]